MPSHKKAQRAFSRFMLRAKRLATGRNQACRKKANTLNPTQPADLEARQNSIRSKMEEVSGYSLLGRSSSISIAANSEWAAKACFDGNIQSLIDFQPSETTNQEGNHLKSIQSSQKSHQVEITPMTYFGSYPLQESVLTSPSSPSLLLKSAFHVHPSRRICHLLSQSLQGPSPNRPHPQISLEPSNIGSIGSIGSVKHSLEAAALSAIMRHTVSTLRDTGFQAVAIFGHSWQPPVRRPQAICAASATQLPPYGPQAPVSSG